MVFVLCRPRSQRMIPKMFCRRNIFRTALKCSQFKCVFNGIHDEAKSKAVDKIRLYKRLGSLALFGATFGVVYYSRKKKQFERESILGKCKLLRNNTFGSLRLYECNGCVVPEPILKILKDIEAFEFRDTDVLLCSFPKTGTTWLQEIIYLIANDLDFRTAESISIADRFPYLEWPVPGISWLRQQKGQRLIKTHLPVQFFTKALENNAKIVSIVRDPKDVLVSFYYFARMNNLIGFKDDFNTFFELFINDKVAYAPIWKHYANLLSVASNNNADKVLIIRYERLKKNFKEEIDKICRFLEKPELSEKDLNALKEHCSFDSMKNNPAVNYEHWDQLGVRNVNEAHFYRKGIVGDWKAHFSSNQTERFNEWFKRNFDKTIVELYEL